MNQRQVIAARDRLLKDAGFDDIETPAGWLRSDGVLAHTSGHRVAELERFDDLEEYYRRAGQFLWDRDWYDDTERRIWELHAEGASLTRIVRTVKREGGRIYRRKAHSMVAGLRAEMLRDELAVRRGRGRPRNTEGLRSHGLRLELLLSPGAALAMDHVTSVLRVSKGEAVRRALVVLARQMTR